MEDKREECIVEIAKYIQESYETGIDSKTLKFAPLLVASRPLYGATPLHRETLQKLVEVSKHDPDIQKFAKEIFSEWLDNLHLQEVPRWMRELISELLTMPMPKGKTEADIFVSAILFRVVTIANLRYGFPIEYKGVKEQEDACSLVVEAIKRTKIEKLQHVTEGSVRNAYNRHPLKGQFTEHKKSLK